MAQQKLPNIQWQFMRQSLWGCVGAVSAGLLLFFFAWYECSSMLSVQSWLSDNWQWSIPAFPGMFFAFVMLVLLAGAAAIIGTAVGYIYGNLMKKRVEILLQSAMKLERGDLTTRVPYLGEDEVGQIGMRMNEMTARFQEQVASLQRLSTHNAELAEQVKHTAVTAERQRLARELHDAISQQLFAISMTMAALKRTIVSKPEMAGRQAELVEEMAAAAQSEMRALLLHLRPAQLEGKPLRQGIEELLNEIKAKQSMDILLSIGEIPDLPKGIEDHIFRIMQESLSNILRHAKANKVEVTLNIIRNKIHFRITDNGVGFSMEDGKKSSSYGMGLMRERVAEIGGVFNVSSAPGHGTMIEVIVPLVQQNAEVPNEPAYKGTISR
ncbi:sensor histidine kinase [Aneurinibacillus sp. Ricciae_BoGa-3]|uniref:HAMP domain-containing sensor histidine kinase n=1 Tax=Aneurinibacillus sp. Ricciae_BoGa-3 TaxID=3022697 RepID=UPI00233FEE95|nr:sensor histidine kinase [Aneurinibacillus sp. Ricciae_BoGa-3]WCK55714.1 sensor histidine kinase [Aneurinibacillus sp. Ricciae_BoGa-3]